MSGKYTEYQQLNLPSISEEILAKWKKENTFEKSVSLREGFPPFVFYEGPPSANGMPGIHHVISRTLKDLVCRYKTMQGYQVKRKGGWDTHGLPIELGVEKELGITKEDIGVKISVEDYNKKCREVVMRFKDKWDDITQKMGYWVDLNDPYVTFENNYIETLWWCLSELYKKGYLYESVSIQPYSPAAGTGLSSHELNQPGTYKDVKDTSAVAMFKLDMNNAKNLEHPTFIKIKQALDNYRDDYKNAISLKNDEEEIFFLAWTTTPWTLPSNLGLAVGPNHTYSFVRTKNPYTKKVINIILAKDRLDGFFDISEPGDSYRGITSYSVDEWTKDEFHKPSVDFSNAVTHLHNQKIITPRFNIAEFSGQELENLYYEQLLPSEANTLEKIQEITPGAQPFKVITGDFVTTEDGTGIVHTAPAFGADDFRAGQKNNLGILTLVDKQGKFVEGVGEFSNRYVKNYKDEKDYVDVNVDIAVKLKLENRAFKIEKYEHNYPHCWRTDKPIIYYPLDAWFIKTTAVKDRMIELNKTINWKPANTGTGRFGNWLENMVDWNLSRSRFWGTPLPIWKSYVHYSPFGHDIDDLGDYDEVCIGSKDKLIKTKSKEDISVSGYRIDLKKLSSDLLLDNSFIVEQIQLHNSELKNGFENGKGIYQAIGKKLYEIEDFKWKDYFALFGFDIEKIRNAARTKTITASELVEFQFRLDHVRNYCIEVSESYLETFDFHKPYIDEIIFSTNKGFLFARVPDLIDVWFDSGAMPYAQWHFPFENRELFAQNFPADFIAEGVDQTRGWFYTLHALGSLLKESIEEELKKDGLFEKSGMKAAGIQAGVAYKTVVSNGLVLDKDGNKMSKRLGNVVNPFETIEKFGADATRWYLITNASPWDNLKFDMEGIKEVQRKFFGTLYNTYQFFALYANVDGFAFKENYIPIPERPEIDQWILSSLNSLIKEVQENFDAYEPTQAGRAIEDFVDAHLSNWYVRLCRRRFWKGEYEHDKICAYQTLYECLETLCKLMAPVAPFFADWLFNNLNSVSDRFDKASVHHINFPRAEESVIDIDLEKRMQLAQDISSLILSLRKKVNLKVRQPLQKVFIPALDTAMAARIKKVEDIIKAETNIKEVDVLGAENDFIKKKAKANFKTLGKKLGPKMKWAAEQIAAFDNITIDKVLEAEYILNPDYNNSGEEPIIINAEDLEVSTDEIPGYEVAVKGQLTVALDIMITDDLKSEGTAREFVNRVQNIRKDSGFSLSDRIDVIISENAVLQPSIIQYKEYICAEILADSLAFLPVLNDGTEIEVNNAILKVNVLKKG